MYEKVEECPSCKYPKFSNYKICKDYSVSSESFALVLCDKCQLIFTNPRPNQENIHTYYNSADYISHTNKANNPINILYKLVRNVTLRQKLNLIQKYTSGKELLDYGCGAGTFLKFCQTNNYIVQGYEPNKQAAAQARNLLETPIITTQSQLKTEHTYDIATAWHVIEHVHELRDTLKLLRKKIKPHGYIFIAVPNINSADAKHYKEYWAAYDVPRHLYHFSQDSFSFLIKACKLKLLAVHPMKFDAYYVSLLSEKYKHGKPKYISALKQGYTSNKIAAKNGEYSSLIYVLSK